MAFFSSMRILLVDVDSQHGVVRKRTSRGKGMPNHALMCLSTLHKQRGDVVGFDVTNPDRVCISVVFSENLSQAKGIANYYPGAEILLGGPGLGIPSVLPDGAEHLMPDYGLYGIDYSMGFTSRGCIRNCPFCVVPKLEGSIREGTPIENFHHPKHKKIVLLDNNLLASPTCHEVLDYLIEKRPKVCFTQGLDIRRVDEEIARKLKKIRFFNWKFNDDYLYFSWDLMGMEEDVRRGIKILDEAGIKPERLMFYMLTGFNTSHLEDYYRFKILDKLGVDPYVMIYNDRKDDLWLRKFERWVIRRKYKSCTLENYKSFTPKERREAHELMEISKGILME